MGKLLFLVTAMLVMASALVYESTKGVEMFVDFVQTRLDPHPPSHSR